MFIRCTRLLFLFVLLNACSSIRDSPKYQLSDGNYLFRQPGTSYKKSSVYMTQDSLQIFSREKTQEPLLPEPLKNQIFLKRSFDVDVITVPFKLRPVTAGLPRQLTTDFNGHVLIGYRIDRFTISYQQTPAGWKKRYAHQGLSIGGFGGLGSTSITPWTTNNQVTDEYTGFILSRGLAMMIGVNNLTVGIGVGWDYLTDRDKDLWIYQNKPWYGLTLGLNLN